MRGKIKVVSFVLCAVFMLGLASTVNAQVNWNVSSNPNEVTQYGVTELMCRVRLQVASNGTSVGSTITVTYQGVTIKNTAATGIVLGGTASGTVAISQVVASTGTGGQVILAVTGGTALTGGLDELTIDGVRADVSTKSVATDVQASLSSAPSTANTFVNVSVVRVATVNNSLTVTVGASSSVFCLPSTNPSITVGEGFAGAFVQYVTSVAGTPIPPIGARTKFGANRNIRIHIVVSTLPTNVTLDWSTTLVGGWPANNAVGSHLELIAQSATGNDALFEFTTPDQSLSDANLDEFTITPTLIYDPDTAEPGSSTVQARLEPQDTPTSTEVPRFNHPYIPPATTFFTVNKCTTNLLFTFLTNATGVGFDSGVAIANTSQDPYGTAPQHGTITLYFYGTNAPAPLTTPDVSAGSVWANSLSTIAPGFQGYMIAVAQFQYGHGYAFITGKYNAGSVYDVAEGYVGIVIPDPTFTPLAGVAHRYAGPPPQNNIAIPPSSGEQLGQ